jgi:hypothetical protein
VQEENVAEAKTSGGDFLNAGRHTTSVSDENGDKLSRRTVDLGSQKCLSNYIFST